MELVAEAEVVDVAAPGVGMRHGVGQPCPAIAPQAVTANGVARNTPTSHSGTKKNEEQEDHDEFKLASDYDIFVNNCATVCMEALAVVEGLSHIDGFLEQFGAEHDPRSLFRDIDEEIKGIVDPWSRFLRGGGN